MTEFSITRHDNCRSQAERDNIMSNPGFGQHFTDHMVTIDYHDGQWINPAVRPYAPITLDPAASVLHYGQAIFEGLKAYRWQDDTIRSFRPQANARRFQQSAERLAMPILDEGVFLQSLEEIIKVDRDWVPASGGEEALYLRPYMFSTDPYLGVRPSHNYTYALIASPAGAYFKGGVSPVSVWLCTEYVRAAKGGTGAAKFAGNYAASLVAQAQAAEKGCDQVVWLDAAKHQWVEEMGGMNLFFVFTRGDDIELVTPELSGSLLPGVTRKSLIQLAADAGYKVTERKISVSEWKETAQDGSLSEVFACGTAAVITPVGTVKHADGEFRISGGKTGQVTMSLREKLTGLQRGLIEDSHQWMTTLG